MKSSLLVLGIIAIFILLLGGCGCNSYNGLIDSREDVKAKWSKVQSAYQRRNDLIGSMVQTIEGSANFEKSTLTEVIAARASATSMKIDASSLTPETLKAFQAQQGQLGAAMGRLMMVTEQYPELKTTDQFKNLSAQLEGTENRIKVARDDYSIEATEFNKAIFRFPANLIASHFGFEKFPLFEADSAAQHAPQIKFNIK